MAFKTGLTQVRFYTEADPYYYTIDNRPLADLATRDDSLADELDKRCTILDINSNGSANSLPVGWTVSGSSGSYRITHNKGLTTYTATGNTIGTAGVFSILNITANYIDVESRDFAGTLVGSRFSCIISQY